MNPKLKALSDDFSRKLQAVADDLKTQNAIPMSDNFPMLSSFAEDEPEAHEESRGDKVSLERPGEYIMDSHLDRIWSGIKVTHKPTGVFAIYNLSENPHLNARIAKAECQKLVERERGGKK